MDTKTKVGLVINFFCSTAMAFMFEIQDLVTNNSSNVAERKGILALYYREGVTGEFEFIQSNLVHYADEAIIELSQWSAYRYIRYNLCDNLLSQEVDKEFEKIKLFSSPLEDYVAQRCSLFIFNGIMSRPHEEFVVYLFKKKKDGDSLIFSFALFFNVQSGEIGLFPMKSELLPKRYCQDSTNRFFILSKEDCLAQYFAIRHSEKIAHKKIESKFSDHIAPIFPAENHDASSTEL